MAEKENTSTSPETSVGLLSSHTPGPWQHASLSDDVIGPRGQGVCSPCDGYDEAQWPVDARLIAAAPDLLAALKLICDSGCPMADVLTDAMVAAIMKAEGRS